MSGDEVRAATQAWREFAEPYGAGLRSWANVCGLSCRKLAVVVGHVMGEEAFDGTEAMRERVRQVYLKVHPILAECLGSRDALMLLSLGLMAVAVESLESEGARDGG